MVGQYLVTVSTKDEIINTPFRSFQMADFMAKSCAVADNTDFVKLTDMLTGEVICYKNNG